ncbi:hypothetical protein [Butyrivibrio sp. AE3009]|uniref:hypothetical protein n=1 Tax=Butyrivibrio sp. AE3009 TaxID=1280666 RepID=UPI0003B792E5|nr:hypothetical protein [Butyrivibrio sp. AE3009]
MGNIIQLSKSSPTSEWIDMSNQGTDCFLELLIMAANDLEKTDHQEDLISFLKDQKDINDIAPGTAGFKLDEMPWCDETLIDDASFLIRVTKEAQSESVLSKLPYKVNTEIVFPWLKQFAVLIEQMITASEQ